MWNAFTTEARRRKRTEKATNFMAGSQGERWSPGECGEGEMEQSRGCLYEVVVKEVQYEEYH